MSKAGQESELALPPASPSVRPPNSDKKLCGYLKLGKSGLLKSFKRKWFVYSENTCKLYYYRSHQDLDLCGEIDIAKATFSFEVTNVERPGLFYISTPDKTHELEAKDRETSLYWLQELQQRRKEFSRRCTAQLMNNSKLNKIHSFGKLDTGLLCRQNSNTLPSVEDIAVSTLTIPVERPKGMDEDEAEELHGKHSSRNWSFSGLKEQVAKKVNRQTSEQHNISNETEGPLSEEAMLKSPPPSPQLDSGDLSPRKSSFRWKPLSSFKTKDGKGSTTTVPCKKCEQMVEKCAQSDEKLSSLEDELQTSREVIKVLQAQLDYLSRQRDTLLQRISPKTDEKQLLDKKDTEISELLSQVRTREEEYNNLSSKLEQTQNELFNLKDQLGMYQTAIEAKDQVLVQLTDQISDLEDNDKRSRENSASSDTVNTSNFPLNSQDATDVDKLKDALQAFQLQNKFLNKEILELNQLRKESEERENKLLVRCSDWEAKYYGIQSKYLLLLNDLHTPRKDDGKKEEVVSQLFEDAMFLQVQPNYAKAHAVVLHESEYDEFGFSRVKNNDTSSLVMQATDYQKRSENINSLIKDPEAEFWQSRWDNFVANLANQDLPRDAEIKHLLRSGIPYEHKGVIWKKCVDMWVKRLKDRVKPGYYQKLLDKNTNVLNLSTLDPATKQIELDLLRTLPNNKHYETLQSDGIPRLRRVLLAYSWRNSEVGYCQGLNRLAAIALLFMNEEDAFWCLVAIIECIMPPEYYSKTLIGAQVDQRVFKDLLSEKLPRLSAHFENCNVDVSLFTFNWFICIFVVNLPVEVFLRIWDVFLYEGTKVLFRFALAFFKLHEEEALQIHHTMGINHFFRTVAEGFVDIKRLSRVAFQELNPFPMRLIKSKRHHHMQIVKAELDELDKMRCEFRARSEPRIEYVDSDED